MARVQCPECKELITNNATKCFKCGTSLRKERIKKYVERKHGDRLNYKKKEKGEVVGVPEKKGGFFSFLFKLFFILLILVGSGVTAAFYYGIIKLDF